MINEKLLFFERIIFELFLEDLSYLLAFIIAFPFKFSMCITINIIFNIIFIFRLNNALFTEL